MGLLDKFKGAPEKPTTFSKFADSGMYVTQNSVYVVQQKDKVHLLDKNGERISDDKPVYRDYPDVSQGSSNLIWGNIVRQGNRFVSEGYSTEIQAYYERMAKPDFIDAMGVQADRVARTQKTRMKDIIKDNGYASGVEGVLGDKKYVLDAFESGSEVENSKGAYKKYLPEQYAAMSLYLEAAKAMGQEDFDKFIGDERISKVMKDMSFNSTGYLAEMKKRLEEHRQAELNANNWK